MTEIYLDNSATTRPYPEVIRLACEIMDKTYGNPASLHEKGLAAEQIISKARSQVAKLSGLPARDIIFTSGGTEANNLAIFGAARRNGNRGKHLVTTLVEHPSVLNCFKRLADEGYQISYIETDQQGRIDPARAASQVRKDTTLVSVMHINNEIGTIEPLEEIGRAIKQVNRTTLFHIDAVQSFGKLPIEADNWQADLISFSAHKLHGPRGSGALWIRRGALIEPLILGGGQEKGMRSGTENTAAVAGFGLAAEISSSSMPVLAQQLQQLKMNFIKTLQANGVEFVINGPSPDQAAPHILNLAFPGVKAEVMLHALEAEGIFVSAGSACHSKHPEPSHVLRAIGLEERLLNSSLRISFSGQNSTEEVASAAGVFTRLAGDLKGFI